VPPLRTPEYEVPGPTVVNLSKGVSAQLNPERDHGIGSRALRNTYNASDFLGLFGFAHFQKSSLEWLTFMLRGAPKAHEV
jgi:hypothetical protein